MIFRLTAGAFAASLALAAPAFAQSAEQLNAAELTRVAPVQPAAMPAPPAQLPAAPQPVAAYPYPYPAYPAYPAYPYPYYAYNPCAYAYGCGYPYLPVGWGWGWYGGWHGGWHGGGAWHGGWRGGRR